VDFSKQAPSKHWGALKFKGEKFAEVWFKPEDAPFGLTFRIAAESFRIPSMGDQLTLENLLLAVGITAEDVDTWRQADHLEAGLLGSNPLLRKPLSPPPDGPFLEIHVHLRPPLREAAVSTQLSAEQWRDLETRWKDILRLESTMDSLRLSLELLANELEGLWKKPLSMEEKAYAPRSDVAQWNKAKSRVHVALPKMRDFIHRAVWALGLPERKQLEALYSSHIQHHLRFPHVDEAIKQLDALRKDRQVLVQLGKSLLQECKGIAAEIHGTLRTLHNNAMSAQRRKGASG